MEGKKILLEFWKIKLETIYEDLSAVFSPLVPLPLSVQPPLLSYKVKKKATSWCRQNKAIEASTVLSRRAQ